MPMILLVLDHIQINVLNIHNPQGSAGHQIMKSPGSSFLCLWNIYDQGWVELVQMFWVWGLLSIQREFERERSPHPGKWNINLKQSHKHTCHINDKIWAPVTKLQPCHDLNDTQDH